MTEILCRINFFIQTVASQMLWYLRDHDDAIRLATTFTVLLPLGGAIGIPPVGKPVAAREDIRIIYSHIGVLLDRGGIFVASLVVLMMGIFFGIFGILGSYSAQLLSICMLVLLRPLMYTFGEHFYPIPSSVPANIPSTVGDYCAKSGYSIPTDISFTHLVFRVFGFKTFGTVYGLANSIAGLFGLILRPIDVLLKSKLHGDYTPPNLVLFVCGLFASVILSWRVWSGTRSVRLQ
jgi:hypothetical protein